jgi:hypothetical protein
VSRLRHRFAAMPGADRVAWLALVLAALGAAALIASQDGDQAPAVPAPSAQPAATTEPAPTGAGAEPEAVVDENEPLLLGETAARLVDARGSGRRVTVRVRLRNQTGRARVVGSGQRLAFVVDGQRVSPRGLTRTTVATGTSETVALRFALDQRQAEVLRRTGGDAELEVGAWGGDERGLIRLRVEGA